MAGKWQRSESGIAGNGTVFHVLYTGRQTVLRGPQAVKSRLTSWTLKTLIVTLFSGEREPESSGRGGKYRRQ